MSSLSKRAAPRGPGARPSPYGFPGRLLWRARPGRTGEMTVPLDTVNDIRSMDAAGRSRSEIARVLHVSRNTVAKYADMEDMSPAAPMPRRRGRPALEGNEEWVMGVLEADLGPRGSSATPPGGSTTGSSPSAATQLVLHRAEVRPRAQARPGGGGRRGVPRARVGARRLPGRFRRRNAVRTTRRWRDSLTGSRMNSSTIGTGWA